MIVESRSGRRAAVAAVAVASALVAVLTGCSSPYTGTQLPHPPPPPSGKLPRPATNFIFGQIKAETESGWDVLGVRGNTYQVILNRRTDYGSLFHRAQRSQFKIGDYVRIAGIFAGTSVTANTVEFATNTGQPAPNTHQPAAPNTPQPAAPNAPQPAPDAAPPAPSTGPPAG
jgi:hypothetical protein